MSRYDRQQQPGGSVIEVLIAMDGGGLHRKIKDTSSSCAVMSLPFHSVVLLWYLTCGFLLQCYCIGLALRHLVHHCLRLLWPQPETSAVLHENGYATLGDLPGSRTRQEHHEQGR